MVLFSNSYVHLYRLFLCFTIIYIYNIYSHAFVVAGVVVVIMMLLFAVIVGYGHYIMIKTGNLEGDYVAWDWIAIWVVDGFLFLSIFDAALFPFCWSDTDNGKSTIRLIVEYLKSGVEGVSRSRSLSMGFMIDHEHEEDLMSDR